MGERVEMTSRREPKHRDEPLLRELCDLADRVDPEAVQLGGCDGSDSPEALDGQRVEKAQLVVRWHNEEAVGLGHATRDLGEELGPRDPHRDWQTDPLANRAPQPLSYLNGGPGDATQPTDVEEGLVDRQPFDERSGVVEHGEHRLARLGVRAHARWHHDCVRTQAQGLPATHRRVHAEGLGLVTRGEHYSHADDHRAVAQARIVSLLDGRVERVEVGVEDRGFGPHEHMFASDHAVV